MENKGLNVFGSHNLLASKFSADVHRLCRVAYVVRHEFGHDWNGNGVVPRDFFHITFDVNNDGLITPATDLNYTLFPNVANIRYQYYAGPGSLTDLQPETFSTMARGFDC